MKASCLCGQVSFTIEGDFDYMGYCHCGECQKFSGSANAAFGGVKKDRVTIEGEEHIAYFEKYEGSRLGFCKHCGSSLLSEKVHWDTTNIRLGLLDDKPSRNPDYHVYVGSKAPWHHWQDDLPKFDELPG